MGSDLSGCLRAAAHGPMNGAALWQGYPLVQSALAAAAQLPRAVEEGDTDEDGEDDEMVMGDRGSPVLEGVHALGGGGHLPARSTTRRQTRLATMARACRAALSRTRTGARMRTRTSPAVVIEAHALVKPAAAGGLRCGGSACAGAVTCGRRGAGCPQSLIWHSPARAGRPRARSTCAC